MDTVVVETEADQQRVDPEQAFEVAADRDRAARADQQRLLAPLRRKRLPRRSELRHLPVERKRRRAGVIDELGPAIDRQPLAYVGAEGGADRGGILAADQA